MLLHLSVLCGQDLSLLKKARAALKVYTLQLLEKLWWQPLPHSPGPRGSHVHAMCMPCVHCRLDMGRHAMMCVCACHALHVSIHEDIHAQHVHSCTCRAVHVHVLMPCYARVHAMVYMCTWHVLLEHTHRLAKETLRAAVLQGSQMKTSGHTMHATHIHLWSPVVVVIRHLLSLLLGHS